MFDVDGFVKACRKAAAGPHAARNVLALMREALKDPAAIEAAVTPLEAGVGVLDAPLFRSPDLTVLNVSLKPGMLSIPHDHRMWAVIGIYRGEEANTFYQRTDDGLLEKNRRRLRIGDAMALGPGVVHAIENPLSDTTRGIHVYGGDLLAAERSMWDPGAGGEHAYDVPQFYRWSADLARSRKAPAATIG